MEHIIFVYAIGEKIKIVNINTLDQIPILEWEGYNHVATINPCVYLEHLYGLSDKEIIKSIRSLCKKS